VELVTSKLQVLDANDPGDSSRWDELVDRAPIPDVYYRPGYARPNQVIDQGKALALLLNSGDTRVLIPLLLRPLSDLPFAGGQTGFDAVTPYGYGGLLPLASSRQPSKSDVPALLDALLDWCNASRVISCHIRLHPLLEQTEWLDAMPSEAASLLCFRGLTAGIDLSRWDCAERRAAGMSANRRLHLNRARRHLEILWSGSGISMAEAVEQFRLVYEHRMAQLGASSYYYFPKQYYAALGDQTKLGVALACFGNEVVGASMFLADRHFAHYHLGGANEKGLKFHASTLLINAGGQWARERGCTLLHLGGGSGGLFGYKRSFGGPVYRYCTLDVIADRSVYSTLVERRLCSKTLPPPRQAFFPAYRA
jgi:hypothetical protein